MLEIGPEWCFWGRDGDGHAEPEIAREVGDPEALGGEWSRDPGQIRGDHFDTDFRRWGVGRKL